MSNQVNDENVGLLRQLVTTVQKKNDKEKVDNSIKMKPAKVIGVDEDTYKVFVYFIDDTEQNAYTFYNKSGEVLSEGDNVRVYYTTNPAKGWIGARCGETNVKETTLYGGEGVGRPSPWDITSEYFNSYGDGTPINIAGTDGKTGYFATAKGFATEAKGRYSYAEGFVNKIASGATASHVEGYSNSIIGEYTHIEGYNNTDNYNPTSDTTLSASTNHIEGYKNRLTNAKYSHVEGYNSEIFSSLSSAGQYNHIEGHAGTIKNSNAAHVGGEYCNINEGHRSFAIGYNCIIENNTESFVGGKHSSLKGNGTSNLLFGNNITVRDSPECCIALGNYSKLEGVNRYNFIDGYNSYIKNANHSFAFGRNSYINNSDNTINHGFSFGENTTASNDFAHAEGDACSSNGFCSYTYGEYNVVSGQYDIAMGKGLTTSSTGSNRFVTGKYNKTDNIDDYLFVIGNGDFQTITNDDGTTKRQLVRSNAFTVDKEGNVFCKSINGVILGSDSSDIFEPYTSEQAVASAQTVFTNVMG